MSDRLVPMEYDQLETQLADLATALAFPRTPDLATAVGSRLRTPTGQVGARPRLLPLPRSLRRSLLLAAALALLIVGGAFAVRFGLELLSIETGPIPTEPPASARPSASPLPPGALGVSLGLGRRLSFDEVDAAADFDVLAPGALGEADAVYVNDVALLGQVAFVYAPREDLPASSLLSGAGLLVTQNQGRADAGLAHKIVDTSLATIEPVDVDGAPGLWISGAPHLFWYLGPDGTFINESRRLVGDTLAWERDGILYRIEGDITLSQALEIARSMR
jgi:hypothetical protein